MSIGDDTYAYKRRLPHLQREHKNYFVTFCTKNRRVLDPKERDVVLREYVAQHSVSCWLHRVVVMPDHVHALMALFSEQSLQNVMRLIKGRSARAINAMTGRRGSLWQRESFDHILRRDEDLIEKAEYIANNPVRAGLVARPEEYRWLWISESTG
jgi:REP element-mobilizing transposase RayT